MRRRFVAKDDDLERYIDALEETVDEAVEGGGDEEPEEGGDGIPVWSQPTGAQDAYKMGDKVHYPDADGPVYESTADDNVWEPGVYGWEQVA